MEKRRLGALEVSAMGLGCMGMSGFYGPANKEHSIQAIRTAYENGITLFDTADVYGFGDNEELLGHAVAPFRSKVLLATKCGVVRKKETPNIVAINGKPEYVRQQCIESLKRLGTSTIDLYYLHHVDPATPIEETIQAMAQLVIEGKVRYIGLCEMSAEHIRRAHAIHPITAIQREYSLLSRDAENTVLPLCKELGIGFVACSPLGRGILGGMISSVHDLALSDSRRILPRFFPENFAHNAFIVATLKKFAQETGCTLAQLAIAWVVTQSNSIVPLFGTTQQNHVLENIGSLPIRLTKHKIEQLNDIVAQSVVQGSRHPDTARHLYSQ